MATAPVAPSRVSGGTVLQGALVKTAKNVIDHPREKSVHDRGVNRPRINCRMRGEQDVVLLLME